RLVPKDPILVKHQLTVYILTLSLHDALPILRSNENSLIFTSSMLAMRGCHGYTIKYSVRMMRFQNTLNCGDDNVLANKHDLAERSEEHTSELQSRENIVCRLLLEKKKYIQDYTQTRMNHYMRSYIYIHYSD